MDFDSYFPDDFDESALAELDQVEQSLYSLDPPPPKRQKTVNGWFPAGETPKSKPATSASFDIEDLPEISVANDSYAFNAERPVASTSKAALPRRTSSSSTASGSSSNRPQSASKSASRANRISLINSVLRASTPNATTAPTPNVTTTPRAPPPKPSAPATADSLLQKQVDAMKADLDKLRNDNLRMQTELRDANEARQVKDGEVAVLRKAIDRTAQDHAKQIANLNAVRDDLLSKRESTEQKWRAEIERLKTQFLFKQQELESNVVKRIPQSARKKGVPSSQFPLSQTPTARPNAFNRAGPSTQVEETPFRIPKPVRPQKSPEVARKTAMLPGFENSFAHSTPKRSSKARSTAPAGTQQEDSIPVLAPKQLFMENLSRRRVSPPPTQDPAPLWDVNGDALMADDFDTSSQEETIVFKRPQDNQRDLEYDIDDTFRFFSQKTELARVLLTHMAPFHTISTLQNLAETASKVSSTSRDIYTRSMDRILSSISDTSVDDDYELVVLSLSRELTYLSVLMNRENLIQEMAAVMNLLVTLLYSFPSFAISLLSHLRDEDEQKPEILVLLCDIVQHRLGSANWQGHDDAFIHQFLSFLEALCWSTLNDVSLLQGLVSNNDVLKVLLDASRPSWFLARSTRLLLLLYSSPKLCDVAFSIEEVNEEEKVQLPPHLDGLCTYLMDINHRDSDSDIARANILASFTVLSLAKMDILQKLAHSIVLLPSLVVYLHHLTAPLWEEDETVTGSPKTVTSRIRLAIQTLTLIHHLTVQADPPLNLRKLLQETPPNRFTGIVHRFIVTFGRLTYTQELDWVDEERRRELTGVYELAGEILDMVVEGPEGETVYAVFQDQTEEERMGMGVDEGEMEQFFDSDS
ncbi:hypothetical protein D9758_002016 [Tetrapyrgos nigripes]|uniref:Uncharacterized protein n=1 Tax=Tetrapyrgos nigripes TaxID=182062 RepID=A0A8H5GTM6_9AGAR|nr:hypothetical protein D9758_002016 [Tetrapyrgos nigripes]